MLKSRYEKRKRRDDGMAYAMITYSDGTNERVSLEEKKMANGMRESLIIDFVRWKPMSINVFAADGMKMTAFLRLIILMKIEIIVIFLIFACCVQLVIVK
jgi:uncharacterized membrane protein